MKRKIIYGLLAVLVSFGLWMYVVTVVNPEWEDTFYNIPVVLENEEILQERGLMLVSEEDPKVTLRLSGNRADMINLNASNSTLSLNKVHVITQDAKGFIWMGTADGLNRYDGRKFRTFGSEDLGTESAFVVSLCADDKGNLWVGTDTGITWYNYEMDTFIPLSQKSDKGTVASNKVSRISIDKEGTVWFSVLHQGLFSYDGKNLVNYFYEDGKVTVEAGKETITFEKSEVAMVRLRVEF